MPVGDPKLDLGELPAQGEALEFSIEIGVLPKAELGDYKGLEVGRREPEIAEEQIEQEIDAMRERLARLETAERAAAEGRLRRDRLRRLARACGRRPRMTSRGSRSRAARAATSSSSSAAAT